MKNLLILLCVLTGAAVFGQNSNSVWVSNAAVHVLYRGYDNPIQVSIPSVSHEALGIECATATVRKDAGKPLWYITPLDPAADRLTLSVFRTADGKKELLKEQIFAVVDRPKPTIVGLRSSITRTTESGRTALQSFTTGNLNRVTRKTLLNRDTELLLDYPAETMLSAKLTISGFTAIILQTEYECTGNRFSADATQAITRLKSGDIIRISDIRATDSEGKDVPVAPCTITIK